MKKGFITLYIVVILGIITLGLLLMYSSNSITSINSVRDNKYGMRAKMITNACVEVALENIRENNYYTGSGSVTIDEDVCNYSVSDIVFPEKLINISGIVGEVDRNLEIRVDSFNPIHIFSWKEI